MQGYPIEEFLRRETARRRSSETVQLYRSCLYGLRDWMALVRGGSGADFEACCAFISSGSVGLVHHWLQTGMAQSPQELAVLAERIILHGMSALKEGEYR